MKTAHSDDRDVSDAGQQARLALEAQASRELVDAQRLAEALDLVDQAIPQVSPRTLETVHERLARATSWAKARMKRRRR